MRYRWIWVALVATSGCSSDGNNVVEPGNFSEFSVVNNTHHELTVTAPPCGTGIAVVSGGELLLCRAMGIM